jgi:hypothetical protein
MLWSTEDRADALGYYLHEKVVGQIGTALLDRLKAAAS